MFTKEEVFTQKEERPSYIEMETRKIISNKYSKNIFYYKRDAYQDYFKYTQTYNNKPVIVENSEIVKVLTHLERNFQDSNKVSLSITIKEMKEGIIKFNETWTTKKQSPYKRLLLFLGLKKSNGS